MKSDVVVSDLVTTYVDESFTDDEAEILRRYFTNLDQPVFALVNLPEVVKGALFARYSRSSLSLRRLFLEEFVGELDVSGDETIDATVGLRRAEELYDKVFFEYGDDSVAQLGGVHLACEQASNVLTKILEWGRLMAYLEQSTRYIAYDSRPGGRYRYYRDPEIMGSALAARYVSDMDRLFDVYAEMVAGMKKHFRDRSPKNAADSDFVYRQAIAAKALDAVRGILPAAALSNVGIYGTGQAYEALLIRMRAHPLPEARNYAELMLTELRKVIPSFLKRVDLADRGEQIGAYSSDVLERLEDLAEEHFPADRPMGESPLVDLTDFDPEAEVKLVAAALYPVTNRSDREIESCVRSMTVDERLAVLRAFVGSRDNRRQRPGRALERPSYRFDIMSDYGAFRDMQRHRMMTIDWQRLSTDHGYVRPPEVEEAALGATFDAAMERSSALHELMREPFPEQAPYAVALAYRVRYLMHMNAREAMHVLELRSTPQGHPSYRQVAQQMHLAIRDVAGHRAIAEMMRFVDHSDEAELERLESERRAEAKRVARDGT